MEIKCPNCGQTCEVDEEPMQGQHLLCPFCDVKFNYTSQNTTENDSNSIANTAETNVDAPTAKIQAICPHCGATYEVDADYLGEAATCGTCDKAFVVKATYERAIVTSGKKKIQGFCESAKTMASAAKVKTVVLWQRLVDVIIKISKNTAVKFKHGTAELSNKMAGIRYSENIQYLKRKNKFATVFIALIAVIGLINIGILSVGIYLGWRYIKGQESAHEALIAQQQAEHDAAQLRREQEEREQRQLAQMRREQEEREQRQLAQMRREQEEREQRQLAQMRREQEERQAAQILSQLLMNGNSTRQSTSSHSQMWNDSLRSVIRVGGGEGARQVQVYEDEMIRQRARQGIPLW